MNAFTERPFCRVDGCRARGYKDRLCRWHWVAHNGLPQGKTPPSWQSKLKLKVDGVRESTHPLYHLWWSFLKLGAPRAKYRGYAVCDTWKNSFEAFVADMGTRPTRQHMLIRIDESEPYSPENCAWATSTQRHAKRLKLVSLDALKNEIIRPGIEKFLTPLALYKGTRSIGRIHRLWNFAIAMMKTECQSFSAATWLSCNEDYAQLCGPQNKIQNSSLYGFFSRLRINPKVTDNIEGLTEYAEWMMPRPFQLTPVPLHSAYRNCAPWRTYRAQNFGPGNIKPGDYKSSDVSYPYVVWERENPANRLVALVHAVVPRGLPAEFRADVCQDLIVDLLSGDLSEDALLGSARKYVGAKIAGHRFNQFSAPLDSELIDVFQRDEARRRFDEYVETEIDTIETSDPFKDYVEEKLSGTFRVTRSDSRSAERSAA